MYFNSSNYGIRYHKKHQLDMMAYTYPYDAVNNTNMLPIDCRNDQNSLVQNNRDAILNSFNLCYPLLQLRFNNHDIDHHPSCFKKGCECRNNLPQDHQVVAQICFDESNNIEWLFVDGTKKKVKAIFISFLSGGS